MGLFMKNARRSLENTLHFSVTILIFGVCINFIHVVCRGFQSSAIT